MQKQSTKPFSLEHREDRLMHIIAAKAICFGEALKPEFKEYQEQVDQECESTCTGYGRMRDSTW